MRRNCNLELRLLPSSAAAISPTDINRQMMEEWSESPENQKQQRQQQQLTIFYNGRVSVWDVTELQARAIIWVASREMEDRMKTPTATRGRRGGRGGGGGSSSAPVSPTLQSQLCSPNSSTGLSMKRSLQRFLQKRQNRILASSPYHY